MAEKGIIDLDVNDEAFTKFVTEFEKFKGALDNIPGGWQMFNKSVEKSTKEARKAGKEIDAAMAGASRGMLNMFRHVERGAATFERRAVRPMEKLLGVARKLGKISVAFGGVGGIASWFGMADLASGAFNRNKQAMAAGVSPGQLSAFRIALAPVLNHPSGLLDRINVARNLPRERYLLNGTIGSGYESLTNTQIADRVLRRAWGVMHNSANPHTALGIAQARGFTQLLGGNSALLRLQQMKSPAALNNYINESNKWAPGLGFSPATAKKWTQLHLSLRRSAVTVETALINALAPLAPDFRRFAREFSHMVATFTQSGDFKKTIHKLEVGLSEFASFVSSKKFMTDVHRFGEAMGFLAKSVGWVHHGAKDVGSAYNWTVNKATNGIGWFAQEYHKLRLGGAMWNEHHLKPRGRIIGGYSVPNPDVVGPHFMEQYYREHQQIHVKVSNSTSSRIDVQTHAAAKPQ